MLDIAINMKNADTTQVICSWGRKALVLKIQSSVNSQFMIMNISMITQVNTEVLTAGLVILKI